MIEERGMNVDTTLMTEKWWKANVMGSTSKLLVICRTCQHKCVTTCIANVGQGHGFGCFCNGGVTWAGEIGRTRFLGLIEERRINVDASLMTAEWWEDNVNGCDSKILVVCKTCGHRCETTAIHSVQQGHGIGCLCGGHVPWTGEGGRVRFLSLIQERRLDVDTSLMTAEWWSYNVTGCRSGALALCRKCHQECTATIESVVQGQGFGCGCRNKTERKFWLEITDGADNYENQVSVIGSSPGKWRPAWAISPRDIGVRLRGGVEINEEIDGTQHFQAVIFGGGTATDPVEQATRDGENCIAALRAGVWVVRYFQPHVIRDSVDWRSYRRDSQSYVVRHATEEPRVIAPATSWDVYCSWASHAGVNPIFM